MVKHTWSKQIGAIGSGNHASVYLAFPISGGGGGDNTSSPIAVKSTNINYSHNLRREARILRQLRPGCCPHIIHCFGEDVSATPQGGRDFNLLLEYAPAGSLGGLVTPSRSRKPRIEQSDVPFYAYQILLGLRYVHDKGFVHGDMKPDNVLAFPASSGKFLLKLADFGVSTLAGNKDVTYYDEDGEEDDDDDEDDEEPWCPHYCRGSLVYAAPEYLATGIHNTSDDIWSLGCMVVEMLTGEPVWLCKDANDLVNQILDEKPEIPDEDVPEMARDFLNKCFYKKECGDIEERWTARMLLRHPFILNNKDVMACLVRSDDSDDEDALSSELGQSGAGWISTEDLFLPFVAYEL
ncbi:unnamed protein product [Cuscuta europaea]|uniref:Protein kinase domain-containing protein n=1 Tax=Cuscuta europaea TaxID=41803 RepID=A0A9P0YSP0_CUSEU|nr:unnamed protein product [Cuscuta europaea]